MCRNTWCVRWLIPSLITCDQVTWWFSTCPLFLRIMCWSCHGVYLWDFRLRTWRTWCCRLRPRQDRGQPIGTNIDTAVFVWPSETELIYLPGTTKVMLTLQLPLIHTVLQDAFENLQASLLIEHIFPDPHLTILFIRKHLVRAARSHLPRTVNIHQRLLINNTYLEKLSHLISVYPSTMMCLITYLALCSYSTFPSGSQRALCRNHQDFLCHHPTKHYCRDSWNPIGTLLLHISNNK